MTVMAFSHYMLKEKKKYQHQPPLSSNQIRLHKNTNLKSFSKFSIYNSKYSLLTNIISFFFIKHNQNNIILRIHTCDLKANLIYIIFNIRFHTCSRKKFPKFHNTSFDTTCKILRGFLDYQL